MSYQHKVSLQSMFESKSEQVSGKRFHLATGLESVWHAIPGTPRGHPWLVNIRLHNEVHRGYHDGRKLRRLGYQSTDASRRKNLVTTWPSQRTAVQPSLASSFACLQSAHKSSSPPPLRPNLLSLRLNFKEIA